MAQNLNEHFRGDTDEVPKFTIFRTVDRNIEYNSRPD